MRRGEKSLITFLIKSAQPRWEDRTGGEVEVLAVARTHVADTVWCSKNIGRYCVSTTTWKIGLRIWPLVMEVFLLTYIHITTQSAEEKIIKTDNKSLSY